MRLVTQLKWRLLEGGGQAYYELGVADSGQLIGLSRQELEQSLETLEAMAGEIGASVIVVKEIEVPQNLTALHLATRDNAVTFGGIDLSRVDGAMRLPRRRNLLPICLTVDDGESSPEGETETEEATSETDDMTSDEQDVFKNSDIALIFEDDIPAVAISDADTRQRHVKSRPSRPTAQSSPALSSVVTDDSALDLQALDIEISAVYKPLPSLRRPSAPGAFAPLKSMKAKSKAAIKAQAQETADPLMRAEERRLRRDKRREERRKMVAAIDGSRAIVDSVAIPVLTKDARAEVVVEVQRVKPPKPIPMDTQPPGPRLIVEALVVRKMTHDEAFFDLGNFALV